jgi:hypothetical protein
MRLYSHARFLALLALALLASPVPAWACSCGRKTMDHEFQESTAVFTGQVTSVDRIKPGVADKIRDWFGLKQRPQDKYAKRITFRVKQSWKGVTSETVEVTTSGGSCGSWYEAGREYVVYTSGEPGAFQTDYCSRTALVSAAHADMDALRMLPELSFRASFVSRYGYDVVALIAGVAGLSVAVLALELRRRKPGGTGFRIPLL